MDSRQTCTIHVVIILQAALHSANPVIVDPLFIDAGVHFKEHKRKHKNLAHLIETNSLWSIARGALKKAPCRVHLASHHR